MKHEDRRPQGHPVVCIQGLGFVGTAMAIATAIAKNSDQSPCFNVIGIDRPTAEGLNKVDAINRGILPFDTSDGAIIRALQDARRAGNIAATTDAKVFEQAAVVIVDIPFDVVYLEKKTTLALENFRIGLRTIGKYIRPDTLLLIETTVPPGACEKMVVPEIEDSLQSRGHPKDSVHVAYSYERVMPGPQYLNSIINFWRVYAGYTPEAADRCRDFLSKIINTEKYPLTRLNSMRAAETCKIIENSYRATTIAMMEEWRHFAEAIGIDLFEITSAIRLRPTHSNIREPGFGVGGYCLTKDPLFAKISADHFFHLPDLKFPFCESAVKVNGQMPLSSLNTLEKLLGGTLKDKTILIMGVSYSSEVSDTRKSPSETFVRHARDRGATVICHDPYVKYWSELQMELNPELPPANDLDCIVLAVGHQTYRDFNFSTWLKKSGPLILDTNNVLSSAQVAQLKKIGSRIYSVGRGII
ncbi:MAG: nucleotide sugar dehydrogenase [Deltaproteobacteria bacterium]